MQNQNRPFIYEPIQERFHCFSSIAIHNSKLCQEIQILRALIKRERIGMEVGLGVVAVADPEGGGVRGFNPPPFRGFFFLLVSI